MQGFFKALTDLLNNQQGAIIGLGAAVAVWGFFTIIFPLLQKGMATTQIWAQAKGNIVGWAAAAISIALAPQIVHAVNELAKSIHF